MFSQTEILEEFVDAARTTHDWAAIFEANEYRARLVNTAKRNERERDPWFRLKQRLRIQANPAAHEKRKKRQSRNYKKRMLDEVWRNVRNEKARERYRLGKQDDSLMRYRKTDKAKEARRLQGQRYRQLPGWAAKRELYNANRRAANAAKKAAIVCTGNTTSPKRDGIGEDCQRMVQQQGEKDAA